MKIVKYAFAAALATSILAGCAASGVKQKDMVASIPTIPADKGRIYFYRSSSMLGAAIQPAIHMDDKVVGDSKPGGFFYVDSDVGNHEIVVSTELDKKLTFTLDKGETKYVKTSISMGVMVGRVIPSLATAEEAGKELPDLSYTGTPAGAK